MRWINTGHSSHLEQFQILFRSKNIVRYEKKNMKQENRIRVMEFLWSTQFLCSVVVAVRRRRSCYCWLLFLCCVSLLCFHSAIAMNKFDLLQCSLFGMFWMFCWMFCSCHVHHRKHTQWNAHSYNRTKKSMSSDSFWIYLRLPSTSHKSSSDVFHRFICERYISSISWFSFCTMTDDEWCSYSSRHNSWPWPCDRSGDGTMMDERRGPHTHTTGITWTKRPGKSDIKSKSYNESSTCLPLLVCNLMSARVTQWWRYPAKFTLRQHRKCNLPDSYPALPCKSFDLEKGHNFWFMRWNGKNRVSTRSAISW